MLRFSSQNHYMGLSMSLEIEWIRHTEKHQCFSIWKGTSRWNHLLVFLFSNKGWGSVTVAFSFCPIQERQVGFILQDASKCCDSLPGALVGRGSEDIFILRGKEYHNGLVSSAVDRHGKASDWLCATHFPVLNPGAYEWSSLKSGITQGDEEKLHYLH